MILRKSSKNGSSISNIKCQMHLNVGWETVRRVLNSLPHLNSVNLARIPPLNPLNKSKRLPFANRKYLRDAFKQSFMAREAVQINCAANSSDFWPGMSWI